MAELGKDVSDFLNLSLDLESQEPRIEFSGQKVVVNGDRDRLWQAVANLVGNALTHTPLGSPIKVEVSQEGETGVLAVIDQGAGISPEHQATIFDPFVQVRRDQKGTGLGLWIAKLIVESSGGTLALKSELGKGSVFTVSLGPGVDT